MRRLWSIIISQTLLLLMITGCEQRQYLPLLANQSVEELPTITVAENPQQNPKKINPTVVQPVSGEAAQNPSPDQMSLPHIVQSNNNPQPEWLIEHNTNFERLDRANAFIELNYPSVSGQIPPGLIGFNDMISAIIQNEKDLFLRKVSQMPAESTNFSLVVDYQLASTSAFSAAAPEKSQTSTPTPVIGYGAIFSPQHSILSILMTFTTDIGGGHPDEHHISLNYDLTFGNLIQLRELFRSGVDYLGTIALYCIPELQKRQELYPEMIYSGASAIEQNYRIWNLTPHGLMITFEEYQVGPYFAGVQSILVPYNYLRNILNPMGVLGSFSE